MEPVVGIVLSPPQNLEDQSGRGPKRQPFSRDGMEVAVSRFHQASLTRRRTCKGPASRASPGKGGEEREERQ